MSRTVIGIEFGLMHCVTTTADCVGKPVITPSVVHFGRDGSTLVGHAAVQAAKADPERSVVGIRRHLGDPDWSIDVDFARFDAVDVAAILLRQVRRDAESTVGPIDGVIVTVPAWFHDEQRRAVRDAAESAGLPLFRLMNEPSAAALAYAAGFHFRGRTLVYTLADDVFDAAIIEVASPGIILLHAADGEPEGFADTINGQVTQTEATVARTLRQAGFRPKAIDAVILAGAAADEPAVREMLERTFGRTPLARIAPAEVIARGAATQARMIMAERDGVASPRAA